VNLIGHLLSLLVLKLNCRTPNFRSDFLMKLECHEFYTLLEHKFIFLLFCG